MNFGKNNKKHIKNTDDNSKRKAECLSRIKATIAVKTGSDCFIEAGDCAVAFAGSKKNMKLLLELFTVKGGDGKSFLYATVDDEVSWQEDDFESSAEFESAISDYIAERIGRTMKTVTTVDKGKITVETYYMNDAGEWVLLSSETVKSKIAAFTAKMLKTPSVNTEIYTPPQSDIEIDININENK